LGALIRGFGSFVESSANDGSVYMQLLDGIHALKICRYGMKISKTNASEQFNIF
jgi:hypothetical protein